jgi:hypothetical protein
VAAAADCVAVRGVGGGGPREREHGS